MQLKKFIFILTTLSLLMILYSTCRMQLEHGITLPKSASNLDAPFGTPILLNIGQMNRCSFNINVTDVDELLNQYESIHFEEYLSNDKYKHYNSLSAPYFWKVNIYTFK